MEFKEITSIRWSMYGIIAIAGVWTFIHILLALGGIQDQFWQTALLVLFFAAIVVSFAQFYRERDALIAVSLDEREPFPEPPLARFFGASAGSMSLWFVIRMYVGAQWFIAGWEKVTSPVWGTSGQAINNFVQGALEKSVGADPAVQGWYASFLQNFVLPNAGFMSFLVTWGELAVGLGILFGVLTGIAAGFGVLMNLNYLLAGTVSTNPILGMLGLFLCFSWRVCGWIGLDRWLLPAIGLPWKPGTLQTREEREKRTPRHRHT